MRVRLRTAVCLTIARPQAQTDAAGCAREGFAAPQTQAMAFLRPVQGDMEAQGAGVLARERLDALLPAKTDIRPGDGVWIGDSGALPAWRCVEVQAYPLHRAARLEKRCGNG